MKPFLTFRNNANEIFIYELINDYYVQIENSGVGFPINRVLFAPHLFTMHDSLEEAQEFIKDDSFILKYGNKIKVSPDFSCPKCGWMFYGDYAEETQAPLDSDIVCQCGKQLKATPVTTWKLEE